MDLKGEKRLRGRLQHKLATAPENLGAGVYQHDGGCGIGRPHRWHILPNSSRVSLLTYKARVPERYLSLS